MRSSMVRTTLTCFWMLFTVPQDAQAGAYYPHLLPRTASEGEVAEHDHMLVGVLDDVDEVLHLLVGTI